LAANRLENNAASSPNQGREADAPHPAIAFLRLFHGEAPWHLTAIGVPLETGGYGLKACTFIGENRETRALEWITRHNNQGADVYFSPNLLKGQVYKAEKTDVAAASWLWVDFDPPADVKAEIPRGSDPTPEQRAAWKKRLKEAREKAKEWRSGMCSAFTTWGRDGLPGGLPAPTLAIDSGRGFWLFWKLKEAISFKGEDAAAQIARVESYARGIEAAFEGLKIADNCHNVDRLARLPGTRNWKLCWPTKVDGYKANRVYELNDFPQVPQYGQQAASEEPSGARAERALSGSKAVNAAGAHAPPPELMAEMLRFLAAKQFFDPYMGVQKDAAGRFTKIGWIDYGMALRLAYGDAGAPLWELTHEDDKARQDAPKHWRSFASEPEPGRKQVTIGTIIRAAYDAGFLVQPSAAKWMEQLDALEPFPEKQRAADSQLFGPRAAPVVELVNGADIKPESIRWLWDGWLARGKMHLIGGQPGTGKTTIAMSFAATVSRAASTPVQWPDNTKCETGGNVVIWSGEDDPADTLIPRLRAAGADVSRVYIVKGVREGDEVRAFDPAKDIAALRAALQAAGGAALIILDPIVSAVSGDSHKNAETRRGLQPLVELARDFDAALIGVTHFSKGTGGREPVERITGSLAFGALARIVLVAANKPAKAAGERFSRMLARAKSNIGPDGGGFAYELRRVLHPENDSVLASRVEWGNALTGAARDLLADAEQDTGGAGRDAEAFIRAMLADGPKLAKELREAATGHGLAWRTVARAKKQMGGVHVHKIQGGRHGGWEWSLVQERHKEDSSPNSDSCPPCPSSQGGQERQECQEN
jgi:hypothetical protein